MCGCWSAPTTKDAFRLSIVSLIITFLAAWWGFLSAVSLASSLCLVFGVENCVDFLSSVVVLWRFFAPPLSTVDEALERKLQQREQRASIAISGIMVVLGVVVLSAAVADFARGPEDVLQLESVMALSFVSLFVFGVLSALKFRYSNKLDSPSLYKDGICSLIGTVLAGALFINTIIVARNPNLWWLDPVVAFCAGLVAIYLGVRALWVAHSRDHIPIFSKSWWWSDKEHDDNAQSGSSNDNNVGVEMAPTAGSVDENDDNVQTSDIV